MPRFKHDDERENALPERSRLERTPDFVPYVTVSAEPLWHPILRRDPALTGPTMRLYVEHRFAEHAECRAHEATYVGDRFGEVACQSCGALMWSPWWVADGLYGLGAALAGTDVSLTSLDGDGDPAMDETAEFIAEVEARWQARALEGRTAL